MTDPFEVLAAPVAPQPPDPAFTTELRARIRRALLATTGEHVTTETSTSSATVPASAPEHSLAPYLAVPDARAALDWYVRVFAAERRGEPYVMPDGRIGHAELVIGDSVLMLADEYPELGLRGPRAQGGVSVSLAVRVPDVDATVERALSLGADLVYPVAEESYGRRGAITDPYGHRWLISGAQAPPAPPPPASPGRGDLAYVTLAVPDDEAAKAFYGAVLGWRFSPGRVERGWNVEGTAPPAGLWGGASAPGLQPCYAVDDVDAAVRTVRAYGGQAQEPADQSYGRLAECTDDQGLAFQLWAPPAP
jgi:uncharacterized glyoxalase superfamily protein PhnB